MHLHYQFQFTHPGRGATLSQPDQSCLYGTFQFTHPGRGATKTLGGNLHYVEVSIHAPREGCDLALLDLLAEVKGFQFTHPGRGATLRELLDKAD